MPLTVMTRIETWPLREHFVISRGAKKEAVVVVAELNDGSFSGRGECVPYPRYDETPTATAAEIEAAVRRNPEMDRHALQQQLPPGAARNALDCAFWALEAARAGSPVSTRLRSAPAGRILTCQTISLDTPQKMAASAKRHADFPLLKLKLGAPGDDERMAAVRTARPDARLVGDANEGWAPDDLERLLAAAKAASFEMIEQPLPADADAQLGEIPHPIPVCADESAHTTSGLETLASRYDAINIKLDKTGGLTEALHLAEQAAAQGMDIMVGCMVSTSLSMAPALHLAGYARWIDLDGPLLLAEDRHPGLIYDNAWIAPPSPDAWA
ncbi:MAG: hypothetical protein RLZ98_2872 [Pseudomonadota bacterium]|jgi:L-alanine-DL-glutamate epimerase-like enolase superfamily enzyme